MNYKIYVINSIEDLKLHFNKLTGRIVGFDIECINKTNYKKSFSNYKDWIVAVPNNIAACTIQVASNGVCLVINLVKMQLPKNKMSLPAQLKKLITSSSWIKAGVAIDNDLKVLSDNFCLGHCSGSYDVIGLANMANISTPNLEYLYNKIVGDNIKKDKTTTICNWTKLNNKMIEYAAKDAIISYELFTKIIEPTITKIKNVCKEKICIKINYNIEEAQSIVDYVSRLNIYAQQNKINIPKYEFIYDQVFAFSVVCVFHGYYTNGKGTSKKKAKQEAAQKMFSKL